MGIPLKAVDDGLPYLPRCSVRHAMWCWCPADWLEPVLQWTNEGRVRAMAHGKPSLTKHRAREVAQSFQQRVRPALAAEPQDLRAVPFAVLPTSS
jgi:hypothetical protein